MAGLRALAAGGMVLATVFSPMAFANDDARSATTYTSEKKAPAAKTAPDLEAGIAFVDDADGAADDYVANNSDRIAFSFRCGGANTVALVNVERVYRDWANKYDLKNAVFYWEKGDANDPCTVVFHSDYIVSDPTHIVYGEKAMQEFSTDFNDIRNVDKSFDLAMR